MPMTPRPGFETILRAAFVVCGVALGALTVPMLLGNTGCGGEDLRKGVGEPCTRSSECDEALVCTRGVCQSQPDGGRR